MTLSMLPGDPDLDLFLIGSAKFLPPTAEKAVVQLTPNGESLSADAYVRSTRDALVLRVLQVGHTFPALFAQSTEVRVVAGDKQVVVPIPGSKKAVAALRACIDQKLPEWGVDSKAYYALQLPPTEIKDFKWMSPDDYPSELLDAKWIGDVIVRLNVDATGKVTNCAVVASSGQESADDVTCRRAVQKLRFNPAIGADGRPVAAVRVRDVVFRIAE